MLPDNMKEVAEYFNENWQHYKNYVANNKLCHNELFAALNQFLHQKMAGKTFTFVDVGCGDGSMIEPVLLNHSIKSYIGIDIAEEVIRMAPDILAKLHCEKHFIPQNMLTSIKYLPSPVEIIFSSYSVHHLSYQEKVSFIHDCKNKLLPGGFFLMIDGIREENQTRTQWLQAYEEYYSETIPNITSEQLESAMKHPTRSDYPEAISTFEGIAQIQEWSDFNVLIKLGLLSFMVFSK
jgi:cyclopropane fatty-acyl-phospholipid synthase-like methyltransferase